MGPSLPGIPDLSPGSISSRTSDSMIEHAATDSAWFPTRKLSEAAFGHWAPATRFGSRPATRNPEEDSQTLPDEESLETRQVDFQPLANLSALPFVSVALPSSITARTETLAALEDAGIEARAYYNPASAPAQCHRGSLLRDWPAIAMGHTMSLTARIISLPINDDLTVNDVERIASVCRASLEVR